MNPIELLPKQTIAWDYALDNPDVTEIGYGGAAGGGKTRLGCYLVLTVAVTYPGSRCGIGRKELKNLKRTTLVSLFEVFNENQLKSGVHYRYNQQDSVIKFNNGSEIVLFDLAYQPADPLYTRFGSYELTMAWADESNEAPAEALNILRTRVGRKNKINGQQVKQFFLETFNPNKGHVYHRFYKPYRDGNLPKFRAFIPALPGDNPHLPPSYIENLKRADKITRERLLYGNFEYDDDDTKLMSYDAILSIFTNHVDDGDKCIVVDVARFGRDRSNIYTFSGWKVIDIESIEKSDLVYLVERIEAKRAKYQVMQRSVVVDEGGVGGGVVDMGGYIGFISNASPIVTNYFEDQKKQGANYKNLKTQCYFYLADKVNKGELAIACEVTPEQKERIIEDLDAIKQDKVDSDSALQIISKEKQKELLGRSPDDGDVLMMRAYIDLARPVNINLNSTFILG